MTAEKACIPGRGKTEGKIMRGGREGGKKSQATSLAPKGKDQTRNDGKRGKRRTRERERNSPTVGWREKEGEERTERRRREGGEGQLQRRSPKGGRGRDGGK